MLTSPGVPAMDISQVAQAHYLSPVTFAYIITSAKHKSLYESVTNPLELPQIRNNSQ